METEAQQKCQDRDNDSNNETQATAVNNQNSGDGVWGRSAQMYLHTVTFKRKVF